MLARLEQKKLFADGSSAGLNLTRAALDAACKYPWTREDAPLRPDGTRSRKFGVYEDDLPVFRWFRAGVPGTRTSMEAQVMDLADDISYSVHDVEDGVVNAVFQLKWLAIPEHRERVVETTRQGTCRTRTRPRSTRPWPASRPTCGSPRWTAPGGRWRR